MSVVKILIFLKSYVSLAVDIIDNKAGEDARKGIKDPSISTGTNAGKGFIIGGLIGGAPGAVIGALIGSSSKSKKELHGEDRRKYHRAYNKAKNKKK